MLLDSGERESFWGRGSGICSLERVARTPSGGLPPPPNPSAPETFWDLGFWGGQHGNKRWVNRGWFNKDLCKEAFLVLRGRRGKRDFQSHPSDHPDMRRSFFRKLNVC